MRQSFALRIVRNENESPSCISPPPGFGPQSFAEPCDWTGAKNVRFSGPYGISFRTIRGPKCRELMLVRAAQASDIADRVRTPKEFLDLSTVIAQCITVRSKNLFVHRSSWYHSYRTPACRYCVFRRTPS